MNQEQRQEALKIFNLLTHITKRMESMPDDVCIALFGVSGFQLYKLIAYLIVSLVGDEEAENLLREALEQLRKEKNAKVN